MDDLITQTGQHCVSILWRGVMTCAWNMTLRWGNTIKRLVSSVSVYCDRACVMICAWDMTFQWGSTIKRLVRSESVYWDWPGVMIFLGYDISVMQHYKTSLGPLLQAGFVTIWPSMLKAMSNLANQPTIFWEYNK